MIANVANQPAKGAYADHLLPRGRVLWVDDDADDLRFYSGILKQQGYEVRSYTSYNEAKRCMESEEIDFVVVNQGGPGFEGRSVLESVMAVDRHTPVLVITRNHDMGCYLDAMQLGAVDYLEKPLAPAEISRVLETHLPRLVLEARGRAAFGESFRRG